MLSDTMKMEEMKQYKGINPRPDDFDSFWEMGLAQVKEHNPEPQFIPANVKFHSADCYDLFFSSVDNARIYAKFLKPRGVSGKIPVLFLFHGYTGDSGDWWDKLAWVQQGFAVVAMDCRGQSGLSEDTGQVKGITYTGQFIKGLLDEPEKLLFRQIYLDTAVLVKVIDSLPEIDEGRMAVHGGSQGGALALVCAALNPKIKKAAVLYPFLCDFQRVYELGCRGSAYEELIPFFRACDPLHERKNEFFNKLGYIDVQNFADKIQADVLWATGLQDESCPPSAQFSAYNKIKANKKMRVYSDYGHETIPGFVDECFVFMQKLL